MKEDLIDRAMGLTFELSRHMRRKLLGDVQKDDCNMLQIHALHMIKEHEGMTMKQMAAFMKVSSPSATSFVNRLVKMGWIERGGDTANRKLVRLKVTAKGNALLKSKIQTRKKFFTAMLSELSVSDQKTLIRILQTLLDSAQKSATL